MERNHSNREFLVGLFVVGGLVIFGVMVFQIGGFRLWRQGYLVKITFDSANGVLEGAPVRYAGVSRGEVKRIRIVRNEEEQRNTVELDVWLPSAIQLEADDKAFVSTLGLLGEKYLEIVPTPGPSRVLTQGDRLAGMPAPSPEDIVRKSGEVLNELDTALRSINAIFGDEQNRAEVKGTVKDWHDLGTRLNDMLDHMERGEGSMGKLLFDEGLYHEIMALIQDIRQHPWKLLQKPKGQ